MDSRTRSSLDSCWMSEHILRDVRQHSRRSHHDYTNECMQTIFDPKFIGQLSAECHLLNGPGKGQLSPDFNGSPGRADYTETSMDSLPNPSRCKLPSSSVAVTCSKKIFCGGSLLGDKELAKTLASMEAKALELRRKIGRSSQKRHRKKLLRHALNVENAVLLLREEVRKLEIQHQVISSSVFTKTPWNVVAEYFRVFRNGLTASRIRTNPSDTSESVCSSESYMQWGFLSSTMAPDVTLESGCGVEVLMEDWKQIMLMNEEFSTQLVCLEAGPSDSIIARVKVGVSFSANSLRHAFPSLPSTENCPIAAKLIGGRLEMRGSVYFQWDHESRRVASIFYSIDMLTPMLQLLGSVSDVSYVFSNANVTPSCGLNR